VDFGETAGKAVFLFFGLVLQWHHRAGIGPMCDVYAAKRDTIASHVG
jgi:hypothetical protein